MRKNALHSACESGYADLDFKRAMVAPEIEVSITNDTGEIRSITLLPGEYVLGNCEGADVRVIADGVAAHHARLTINYHEILIEDLGSQIGTQVNGRTVDGVTRVWPSQKIQIAGTEIRLHRRLPADDAAQSLAPETEALRALLPAESLRERKYSIGGVIAQGGMGAILDAREAAIERTVAMKVMLDASSAENLKRFVAEARITGQLEHPNIVPVHELGVDENEQVFYTMKFVRGTTLREILESLAKKDADAVTRFPLGQLLTIFQKVCDAVAFAHSRGVIHRDLKPDNIMLGDFGEVLVMDWGLAKMVGSSPAKSRTRRIPTRRVFPDRNSVPRQ
jgi:hypothetical protein